MKPILSVLALLLIAPSLAISDLAAPAAGDRGVDFDQLLAANKASVCSVKPEVPSGSAPAALLDLAAAPHCCGAGAGAACRDLCKQQGPGCKGTIGCRAGECVCTCSCP